MIIETKEIYKCEYCKKLYQMKHFCEVHEKQCAKNPNNYRICFGCEFLCKKRTHITIDNEYVTHKEPLDLLYCRKIESFLYPPKVQHKSNMFDLGDKDNIPMRIDCKYFKDENFA